MADPLYELLVPYFDVPSPRLPPSFQDATTSAYLNRLTTLPLSSLTTSEPEGLGQTTHSLLLSLQALSKRSYKSIIESSTRLSAFTTTIPDLATSTRSLQDTLPKLDDAAVHFSENYNARNKNAVLDRRRQALLLSRNVDRLTDVLDLPTILSSAVSSSNSSATGTAASSSNATLNYASALDLNAHIRRLNGLYPDSLLVRSVEKQAEEAMQDMATNLITSLKASSLKLAHAMRTISWLRRVAPELDDVSSAFSQSALISSIGLNNERGLGPLLLVCRLANLQQILDALEPLKELADQETLRIKGGENKSDKSKWESGQQTERFLKRYVEIFREQSFAIISMHRSIFPPPSATSNDDLVLNRKGQTNDDPFLPLPSVLSTFALHLVTMLADTLSAYLPNVRDKSSRDSLLTQVLYCAGSLGRLGGDFSLLLASLATPSLVSSVAGEDEDETNEEWAEVIKKHRVLAGRLELMVGGRDG